MYLYFYDIHYSWIKCMCMVSSLVQLQINVSYFIIFTISMKKKYVSGVAIFTIHVKNVYLRFCFIHKDDFKLCIWLHYLYNSMFKNAYLLIYYTYTSINVQLWFNYIYIPALKMCAPYLKKKKKTNVFFMQIASIKQTALWLCKHAFVSNAGVIYIHGTYASGE